MLGEAVVEASADAVLGEAVVEATAETDSVVVGASPVNGVVSVLT